MSELTRDDYQVLARLVYERWDRLSRSRAEVDAVSPLARDLLRQQVELETLQGKLELISGITPDLKSMMRRAQEAKQGL